MKFIDKFLNSITMYRLLLYGLTLITAVSVIYGFAGIIAFGGLQMLASAAIIVATCYITNLIFAKIFRAPRNTESAAITGLILYLIMIPLATVNDIPMLLLVSTLAMASKYILAINKKHLFNPAAAGSFIVILIGGSISFWWMATLPLLPFITVIGLLIVRKIRRFELFAAYLFAALTSILIFGFINKLDPSKLLLQTLTSGPLIFFGTFMLTEPLTTPPTKKLQIVYGLLVGALFGSQFEIGPLYSTPEFALIAGNLFSFIVSPKQKLMLNFREKIQLTPDIYEFIFSTKNQLKFAAGQYLEWTLPHHSPDDRGNRRYFTIASSPTEKDIKLGVRIEKEKASSFKKALAAMDQNYMMAAGQLAGEFTLPKDKTKKLTFIAGGIGITPFRSMIKYLIDTKEKRDITLFYVAPHPDSFAYKNIFDEAKQLGINVIYVITRAEHVPQNWNGKTGYITAQMIEELMPDFQERMFYLSGPESMVNSYKEILTSMKLHHSKLMIDYFPGF